MCAEDDRTDERQQQQKKGERKKCLKQRITKNDLSHNRMGKIYPITYIFVIEQLSGMELHLKSSCERMRAAEQYRPNVNKIRTVLHAECSITSFIGG